MMRSYEECRQEILRRAEARIHKRRKLKKQLLGIGICAACFALCLGVLLTGRYEAPPQLEAKGQSAVKEGAVFDAPICDLPAADAPAAAAPTMDPNDEPDEYVHEIAPAEEHPWEIPPENTLIGTAGESFTDYEGAHVQVESMHLDWGTMVFEIWNQSGEILHLSDYDIVRWEENQWASCAVEEKWRAEPMGIPSYQNERAVGLHTTWRDFDFTKPGLYRYTCTFCVGEDETPCTMWAEFTLEEPKLAVDALGEFGSDYPGIYLEFSNVFLEEGYIQAFWRNETELPARIYEGYDLQYLDGDNWVSCKKEYPQFGENIYELAPWPSHVDVDYSISPELFDLSRAGEYRLTGQFWVEGGDVLYTAWAWFTLSMQKQ